MYIMVCTSMVLEIKIIPCHEPGYNIIMFAEVVFEEEDDRSQ